MPASSTTQFIQLKRRIEIQNARWPFQDPPPIHEEIQLHSTILMETVSTPHFQMNNLFPDIFWWINNQLLLNYGIPITFWLLSSKSMSDKNNKNIIALRGCIEAITTRIGTENLAISLMVIANLMWPLSHLYVTEHHFSPFQTSLARGLSICLTHILLCRFFGIDLDFRSSHDIKYLFIRNSLIIFHQLVYAGLHFILPFPLVNSITITGPLFVFVIDYYINNITITKSQAFGILIGFTGVLININGEYIISWIDPSFHF